MAVKLIFESSERSKIYTELTCYANIHDEIYISIESEDYPAMFVCLDKQTAIKLSKVLKTEISKIR